MLYAPFHFVYNRLELSWKPLPVVMGTNERVVRPQGHRHKLETLGVNFPHLVPSRMEEKRSIHMFHQVLYHLCHITVTIERHIGGI